MLTLALKITRALLDHEYFMALIQDEAAHASLQPSISRQVIFSILCKQTAHMQCTTRLWAHVTCPDI